MVRHPSIGSQLPVPLRLYGRRVTLRPLDAAGLPGVERGPPPQRRLVDAVGAPPAAVAARPDAQPRRLQRPLRGPRPGRVGRRRLRVRRVPRPPADRRGQPQQRPARRHAERHGRVLDRPGPGRSGADRRERRRAGRVRLRAARPPPAGDLHRPPQPQQPSGDGEAGHPRGGHRPALPRDQRDLGGPRPLRHHRRGVGRPPRRPPPAPGSDVAFRRTVDAGRPRTSVTFWVDGCGERPVTARRRGAWPAPWRSASALRRFHIFSFQWRGVRLRLATCSLATSASLWCTGFHAAPGSCTSAGSSPELTWLATSCSSTWIRCRSLWAWALSSCFDRQRHVCGAVALAHSGYLLVALRERRIWWCALPVRSTLPQPG